jgi:putative flavoprotein involved in K+ transport
MNDSIAVQVPDGLLHDLIVVGGGQAGLAASYWASRAGMRHQVLEASSRTGDTWRCRYDSLRLFTPRSHSQLPDLALPGAPAGLPTKDDLADYLERYVIEHRLPVQHDSWVHSVRRVGDRFEVETVDTTWTTNAVIIATGPFQLPRTPEWAAQVGVQTQLHSSEYRNPSNVPGNRVLVVGGGNSGAQIAEELALAGRAVTWSCSTPPRFVPQMVLGRNLFWWLDRLGMLEAAGESRRGQLLQRRGDPIIGTSVRALVQQDRMTVKPASVGPTPTGVTFADGTSGEFDGIVWSTGFEPSYEFLEVPGALDDAGRPRHRSGYSSVDRRLMFLGLSWLTSRGSGLVGGVGTDARRLVASLHRGAVRAQLD